MKNFQWKAYSDYKLRSIHCYPKIFLAKHLFNSQLHDYPSYANFMNAVLEKIHAVEADTWVNLTSLLQK